ncbi:MAG: signal peptidase I [Actinomycetes bacterium]
MDSTEAPEAAPSPADSGAARSRSGGHRRKRTSSGSFWRELPVLVIIALALALLLKTFLVQAFFIPSGSMENTLQVGDRVLVNRLVYRYSDIKRGDVIVFNGVDSWTPEVQIDQPTNPIARAVSSIAGAFGFATPNETDFIKRVIGVPGDRVKCCDKQGRITVNGVPLDEPYVYPGDKPSEVPFDQIVPEGRVWVMGDHRGASSDSRYHLGDPGGGTIPIDHVVGRAFLVVWPFNRFTTLPTPDTFKQPGLSTP